MFHLAIAITVVMWTKPLAAELRIESFQSGRLVWSGATPGTTNWIEWAPRLHGVPEWRTFTSMVADSAVMESDVPVFYRIRETPLSPALPTRYDLRDHGWVTPVKSQIGNRPTGEPDIGNSIGICWATSAMAAFESSLLKQGFTTDPGAPGSSFSVWHLGNAIGEPPLEYNKPCYVYSSEPFPAWLPLFQSDPPTTFGYLSPDGSDGWGGGDVFWLLDYLLAWNGPVYEAHAPVPVETMTARETLVWTNRHPPTANYILRGAFAFRPDDYATTTAYRTAAKRAIVAYGAIQSEKLLLPGDFPEMAGLTFYDESHFAIYCPRANLEPELNHAIAIIGWDDEYLVPAAPAPGAWLIRESMGTNVFDRGYHWISYEDRTFLRAGSAFLAVVAASGDGYQWPGLLTHPGAQTRRGLMQTDFLAAGSSKWGRDSQGYARFRTDNPGTLKAIGLVTLNRHETVTIEIFSGVDAALNPSDPMGRMTVELDERGYHLIDLDAPIDVPAHSDLIISLTFAYRDQSEPLVYVVGSNPPAVETYLLEYSALDPVPRWTPMTDIEPHGVLFLQALFTDN